MCAFAVDRTLLFRPCRRVAGRSFGLQRFPANGRRLFGERHHANFGRVGPKKKAPALTHVVNNDNNTELGAQRVKASNKCPDYNNPLEAYADRQPLCTPWTGTLPAVRSDTVRTSKQTSSDKDKSKGTRQVSRAGVTKHKKKRDIKTLSSCVLQIMNDDSFVLMSSFNANNSFSIEKEIRLLQSIYLQE